MTFLLLMVMSRLAFTTLSRFSLRVLRYWVYLVKASLMGEEEEEEESVVIVLALFAATGVAAAAVVEK